MILVRIFTLLLLSFLVNPCAGQLTPIFYSTVEESRLLQGQYYGRFIPRLLAEDLAGLLEQSGAGRFEARPVQGKPSKGIMLLLDSSLNLEEEEGRLTSDGKGLVILRAKYATGMSYAAYSWLMDLGFRFYLPGKNWTKIPSLATSSLTKRMSKKYQPAFRMRMFFASGGSYAVKGLDEQRQMERDWQEWYQRNRMGCAYIAIEGHAAERFNIENKELIRKDSLILAPVAGKRQYAVEGKLDPTYSRGVEVFGDWVLKQYENKQQGWPRYLPPRRYASADMGDGLNYCRTPDCLRRFRSVSDQAMTIVNHAADKIKQRYPNGGVSTLAYTDRADTSSIDAARNVHVMVVPTAFQSVGTASMLMKRWAAKTKNISQYDYLNIGVWSWDKPFFHLSDYQDYLRFVRKLGIEGMHYETSLSSMASGILQYCILRHLCDTGAKPMTVLSEFCRDNFGRASGPVWQLFQEWYDSDVHLKTNYDHPGFYGDELGRFFTLLDRADSLAKDNRIIRKRIHEIKGYLVYLCMYQELHNELASLEEFQTDSRKKINHIRQILEYTWSLYDTRIFHNTQLGDLYSAQLNENEQADWDFRSNPRFDKFSGKSDKAIDDMYPIYRKKYLPQAHPLISFGANEFRRFLPYSADSIRISSIDETAFTNFMYPLSLYSPGAATIRIRYKVAEPQKPDPNQDKVGMLCLEKKDYSLVQPKIIREKNSTGIMQFSIPAAGHYRLYLGQYQACPAEWIVYPGKTLFYHQKKSIPMNGIRLQEAQDSKAGYPNKYLAVPVSNGGEGTIRFSMMYPTSANQTNWLDFRGNEAELRQTDKLPFYETVLSIENPLPGIWYYSNKVFRWPPVLINTSPIYLFLKYPPGNR